MKRPLLALSLAGLLVVTGSYAFARSYEDAFGNRVSVRKDGSLRVVAGSGDDLVVYRVGEAAGSRPDEYDGGAGWDTLRIEVSPAELEERGLTAAKLVERFETGPVKKDKKKKKKNKKKPTKSVKAKKRVGFVDLGLALVVRRFEVLEVAVSDDILALNYNVAGLPEGISGSQPTLFTPLIGPLLNGYELVLLQESWANPPPPIAQILFHDILAAASEHPYQSDPQPIPLGSDPGRPSAGVSDGLNRFSDFPFGEVFRERWSECLGADCLSLKGFSMARTQFAEGVEIDVYNLHMQAGGGAQGDVLRDQGMGELIAFLLDHSADRAVIVGGDFNLHGDEEPDASILQRLPDEAGLSDACAALACAEPDRIEKFFFRSGGGVSVHPRELRFERDVFISDGGEPLSDHPALAVRFDWSVVLAGQRP